MRYTYVYDPQYQERYFRRWSDDLTVDSVNIIDFGNDSVLVEVHFEDQEGNISTEYFDCFDADTNPDMLYLPAVSLNTNDEAEARQRFRSPGKSLVEAVVEFNQFFDGLIPEKAEHIGNGIVVFGSHCVAFHRVPGTDSYTVEGTFLTDMDDGTVFTLGLAGTVVKKWNSRDGEASTVGSSEVEAGVRVDSREANEIFPEHAETDLHTSSDGHLQYLQAAAW